MKSPTNNANAAARRIAYKRHRDAFQQNLSKLDPEYVAKLRHDALRSANERMRGADPFAVLQEAEKDFRARVAFLTEKSS
jgi:hypothetical protein